MKPKNKIVRLRNKYPLMSNAEIGREIGVSRVYVYNILKKNDLITNVPRKTKVKYCDICGNTMNNRRKSSTCSPHCRFLYNRIRVTCSFCTIDFYLRRSEVEQRYKRGYKNIYCSRICYYKGQKDIKSWQDYSDVLYLFQRAERPNKKRRK